MSTHLVPELLVMEKHHTGEHTCVDTNASRSSIQRKGAVVVVVSPMTRFPKFGAQSAIALLDTLTLTELVQAIVTENHKLLAKAPGIGKKTAERLASSSAPSTSFQATQLKTA